MWCDNILLKLQNQNTMRLTSILSAFVILASCSPCSKPEQKESVAYHMKYQDAVPDSLREKYASMVVELTRAGTQHLTGGDIENPERIIAKAEKTAFETYATWVPHLVIENGPFKSVPYDQCTLEQKSILDQLIKEENSKLVAR